MVWTTLELSIQLIIKILKYFNIIKTFLQIAVKRPGDQ